MKSLVPSLQTGNAVLEILPLFYIEAEPLVYIPCQRQGTSNYKLRITNYELRIINPPPKDPNLAAENKPLTPQLTAYQ